MNKKRVAFIKFGGLSAGGTERWLQMMAAHLPKEDFEIDYYYCDAAPYVGSDYKHAGTHPDRLRYMQENHVNLIEFHVGAKDITKPTHDWLDTDFWKVFDPKRYDLVQTAKAGPAEYPYFLIDRPVIEYVTLLAGVDHSPNIARSLHLSQWQRARWVQRGGDPLKSAVIPIPADPPASSGTLRRELDIPENAVVAGFHQRDDNNIASPIPLSAFAALEQPDRFFVLMGGGKRYQQQAQELGIRNIRFIRHSADAARISAFLNTLDLFAHGRQDGETFGTVFAEAMMHGKPCLSHRSLGANAHQETIGPAGFFAQDLQDYIGKMSRLFTDSPLRKALGTKARRHAETYYSRERAVKDLTAIYGETLGRIPPSQRKKSSYGLSPLEFLYPGDLDSPGTIAHHVVTGEIPDEAALQSVRFFLPRITSFIDVGAHNGLFWLVAAREGLPGLRVVLLESDAGRLEQMKEAVWLNNWENRVTIADLGQGGSDALDRQMNVLALSGMCLIKIDAEGSEMTVLEGARQTIERDKPVLFLKIAGAMAVQTQEWLSGRGYRFLRYDDQSMVVALHAAKDGHLIAPLKLWMRAYRRKRRWSRLRKGAWNIARGLRRRLGGH